MDDHLNTELECVDAGVGQRILELDSPTLDADERVLLEAHRDVCAYCRLTLDLHHELGKGIRDGSILSGGSGGFRTGRNSDWMGWSSLAALAASFVFLVYMPPRPAGPSISGRGNDETRFLRPVEGEVVQADDMTLKWTAVPGADRYRLRISGLGGGATWAGTTRDPHLEIPSDAGLRDDETYRALLSTVPADLLPPGGTSVAFRTGNSQDVIFHRLRHAQPLPYIFALTGLGLAAAFLAGRRS